MQGAFAIVLFVVVGVAAVAAIWALVTSGGSYDQIGHGGLSIGDEQLPGAAPSSSAEREAEIRQMLEARNARRAARGESTVDVEQELHELTRPSPAAQDPEILEEVRTLVEARNARRIARGQEPLDVDAEIERQLRDLPG